MDSPGREDMAKKVGSDQLEAEEGSGDSAKRIADAIGPLIRLARSRGFDFLPICLPWRSRKCGGWRSNRTYTPSANALVKAL